MVFQEVIQLTPGIVEIAKNPGFSRTNLKTSWLQTFFEAMKAQGAFVNCLFYRMNIPASVRTCLNAVPASNAIILIYQNDPFGGFKCCTDRTNSVSYTHLTLPTNREV